MNETNATHVGDPIWHFSSHVSIKGKVSSDQLQVLFFVRSRESFKNHVVVHVEIVGKVLELVVVMGEAYYCVNKGPLTMHRAM